MRFEKNETHESQVKGELTAVSNFNNAESFARLDYHQECEAGVNEQINIELNIAYVYHSLFAYFDRQGGLIHTLQICF